MIPLEPVLEKYGVDFRPDRHEQVVLCPFHDDTHPSMSVNLDNGLFYCFACGAGGSPVNFVMRMEGKNFADSKRIAEEAAGTSDRPLSRGSDSRGSLLPRKSGHRPGRRNWVSPWKSDRPGPNS